MRYPTIIILLAATLCFGCGKPSKRKPKRDNDSVVTAATIHVESAQKRADVYDDIADKIEDGELKTMNDVVEFSDPLFRPIGEKYVKDITALREKRMQSAEEALPDDAAEQFRKFADEYRSVAIKTKVKR